MSDAGVRPEPLLYPSLLARLERLQLGTRRPLAGRLTGEHRSPTYGSSVDFADHREYQPGDDFRRIDFAAYARLDALLVRLFEAEEDLHVRLLVDTSRSMAVGGKQRAAARVAAALGFVALVRRDTVSLHTFPGLGRPRRYSGRHAVPQLLGDLASLRPAGTTGFAAAVTDLLGRRGPAGLTVLVSDLLTIEWDDGLRRLPSRRDDLVVVQILARSEIAPSTREELMGDVDLIDAESGERTAVSLDAAALRHHEELVARWLDEVAGRTRAVGGAYTRFGEGDDLEQLLLGAWAAAGMVR